MTKYADYETLEEFCEAQPPSWSTPEGQPALDIEELKRSAHHLLGINHEPGGYMPGSFTTALITLWGRADNDNQRKLASQWPELAAVIFIQRSGGGFDSLRAITEGKAP